MRRTYISPEFINSPIYGTYNMVEESNFFGAKMLNIEDQIYISNQNIIYYQKETSEQIDLAIESSLPTQVYVASDNKLSHHRLYPDPSQGDSQKESNTKWILDINIKSTLTDYIFATLKRYRTFEGLTNNITRNNDVNAAVTEYITKNVLDRYKFSRLDIYINYKDITSKSVIRWYNTWNPTIMSDTYIFNKKQNIKDVSGDLLQVLFTQEQPSSSYNFDYYFNILFERI